MTSTTDALRHPGATPEAAVAALHRALTLAEAAGDEATAAALRQRWFDLERRRLAAARTARPWHRERHRSTPPRLVVDDTLADAWLRGGPLPPR
jgi:hypothetical protein